MKSNEKYRIKSLDIINDIWLLQKKKRFLLIPYWSNVGVGSENEVGMKKDELSGTFEYRKTLHQELHDNRKSFKEDLLNWVESAKRNISIGFTCGMLDIARDIANKNELEHEDLVNYECLAKYPSSATKSVNNGETHKEMMEAISKTHLCWGGGEIDLALYFGVLKLWKLGVITSNQKDELKKHLQISI
jgi:hypothetical protein